jgi:thioredoxin-like negative regulator of GroEL
MAGQYAMVASLAGASVAASLLVLPGDAERAAMHLRDREFGQALELFESRLASNGPQVATVAPLARLYAQQGDLARAIAMLENLIASAPLERAELVDTRKLLQTYLRWANREEARRDNLVELARLEPARAAIRELAALASFANDIDQQIAALALLATLPDAEPDDFVDLAELRAARREFGEAAATLAALAARFPAAIVPSVLEFWIGVLIEDGAAAQAMAIAQARLPPAAPSEIVGVVASAFLGRGRAAEALGALAPVEGRLGDDPAVNMALLRAASDAQDFPLLARLFDLQLARGLAGFQPRNLGDLVEFGFAAGRETQALALAERLDPRALGDAQLAQLIEQALALRQTALLQAIASRIDPARLARVPILAARMHLAAGRRDLAAAAALRAAETPARTRAETLDLVQIFASLEMPARALRLLEATAREADLPETAIGDMAQLYILLTRPQDGAVVFERLRSRRPNSLATLVGWALTNALSGRANAVAAWLDADGTALASETLTDLFFVGADVKSPALQLAAARRLRALEGATPQARLRLAQAALAAGRALEALPEARALRADPGGDEAEFLYREALGQVARGDAAARAELRGYWRARLADASLPQAARDESLYALIDQRAWDDALPELARRARRDPGEWLGAYVSSARSAGRESAVVDVLQAVAGDGALPQPARANAAYALLELAPAQALGVLRRMAADIGGEWQDALDLALERAGLREELLASLAARAQAPGLDESQRGDLAFRLLELGDKAAALDIYRKLAEGQPADSVAAQQALYVMGPRPEPAQLAWIETQAQAASGEARVGWIGVLRNVGASARAAELLAQDAMRPGRAGSAAALLAAEIHLAAGERATALRLLEPRIADETVPDYAQRAGELAQALGRADLARRAFDRFLLLDPSRPAAQRLAGLAAYAAGDIGRAQNLLQRYLAGPAAQAADDWEAHYALGEIAVRLRDRAAARVHHAAAVAAIDRLEAPPAAAQAAKAYALFRLGLAEQSVELFAQLLRAQPGNRDLRADYASVLIELGRTAEARLVLEDSP